MPSETDRAAFEDAHRAWGVGDLEGFFAYMHPDVLHIVNVDGLKVPYAMSALGRQDMRDRLDLVQQTFDIVGFTVERIVHEQDSSRSLVHGIYRHKKTGEVLDFKLRFRGWLEHGLVTRLEETLDAPYIEAFERFVFHIGNATGNGPATG